MHTTPPSLLERLRRSEERTVWDCFVQLYTPLLCCWARRLGAERDEVEDLVQDVFTLLVQKLPEFTYQPDQRFRGWLWTVTRNKWLEKRRRRAPAMQPIDNEQAEPWVDDLIADFDEAEYRQVVVRRAMELMRSDFESTTWRAFWECVVEERPAAAVADALGLSANAVYLAKGRVMRRLRQELDGLLD